VDLYGAGLENRAAVERILGDGVIVTDSAEAIARQVRRVLEAEGLPAASGSAGRIRYGSTHPDPPAARARIEALAGPHGHRAEFLELVRTAGIVSPRRQAPRIARTSEPQRRRDPGRTDTKRPEPDVLCPAPVG
jgi:hypothetical protein